MSKARDLADSYTDNEIDSDVINAKAGRKNLIINGDMRIAQRGTSQATNGYGSLDRWVLNSSAGAVSVTQTATTAVETSTLGGLEYYSRLVGTATDSIRQWFQRVEGLKKFSNKTITVSFYAKAAASTTIDIQYGLVGAGNDTYAVFATKEIGTVWTKYTATVTLPSMSSGFNFGSNSHFRLAFELKETNYTLDITGVQLELGSQATDFEYRSYGEELALCQRYYEVLDARSSFVMNISAYHSGKQFIPFTVEKRADPTLSFGFSSVSNFQYYGNSCSGVSGGANKKYAGMTYTGFAGWNLSAGGCVYVSITNTGSTNIYADAEL